MIKCSNNILLSQITKLFDLILDTGYNPETWNHGLIQYTKMVLKRTLQIIEESLY